MEPTKIEKNADKSRQAFKAAAPGGVEGQATPLRPQGAPFNFTPPGQGGPTPGAVSKADAQRAEMEAKALAAQARAEAKAKSPEGQQAAKDAFNRAQQKRKDGPSL